MMNPHSLKAKIIRHKLAMVWAGIALTAFAGLAVAYNFAFNPASSVRFTVYVPQQKATYGTHLVIPGYEDDFITIFGLRDAVVGYAVNDGTKVIQEKSTTDVTCDGLESCIVGRTKNGQSYVQGTKKYNESDSFEQVVLLKKGDTKITIRRPDKQPFTDGELNALIDTLHPASIGRPYVYGRHEWTIL